MSLANEIVMQSADHMVPLTTILRKCLILSARLSNEELKRWVLSELEGYPKGETDNLPPYRKFGITAKGFFVGPYNSSISDQPLPSVVMEEEHRWWATTAYAMQGIAGYEALVAKDPSGKAMVYWPADLVVKYQESFYEGYTLNRAWQEIPISGIAEILDTVRTKVLQLVLELQSDITDLDAIIAKGDAASAAPVVEQVFHTVIYGGTAVVGGHAGHSINVVDQQLIVEGDFGSLAHQLAAGGVSGDAIAELQQIVAEETQPATAGAGLGKRIGGWVATAAKGLAQAGGKVTVEIASKALTSAVMRYYGLPH